MRIHLRLLLILWLLYPIKVGSILRLLLLTSELYSTIFSHMPGLATTVASNLSGLALTQGLLLWLSLLLNSAQFYRNWSLPRWRGKRSNSSILLALLPTSTNASTISLAMKTDHSRVPSYISSPTRSNLTPPGKSIALQARHSKAHHIIWPYKTNHRAILLNLKNPTVKLVRLSGKLGRQINFDLARRKTRCCHRRLLNCYLALYSGQLPLQLFDSRTQDIMIMLLLLHITLPR